MRMARGQARQVARVRLCSDVDASSINGSFAERALVAA